MKRKVTASIANIAFSIVMFILSLLFYYAAIIWGWKVDNKSAFMALVIITCILSVEFILNFLLQMIFINQNIKIKSYVFCFTTIWDVGFTLYLHETNVDLSFALFLGLLSLKLLIVRGYYKIVSYSNIKRKNKNKYWSLEYTPKIKIFSTK
jgi:hypothetical protein